MGKRQVSIKYRLVLAVLLLLIPITLVFSMFTTRAITHLNQQLAEANRNTLQSFCTAVTDEIRLAEGTLNLLWGENEVFERLGSIEEPAQVQVALEQMEQVFAERMESNRTISCLALYSPDFGFACETYAGRTLYSEAEKQEIRSLMQSLLQREGGVRLGWFVADTESASFLIRIIQKDSVAAVCFVDLRDIARRSQSDFAMVSPVVFVRQAKPLTHAVWLKKTWGAVIPEFENYSFAGADRQYMVVKDRLMGLEILYGVPYQNHMGALGWLRLGPWLLFGVMAVVLMVVWIYMKVSFFRPLNELIKTMERISANDLESRSGRYTSREFAQVNETFNHMIETITNLKIENYEQRISAQKAQLLAGQAEINAQKAELAALRLQIHPHFYLNCLKNIYGMAQYGSFQDIQKMILMLSSHLRYTFTITKDVVSLGKELQMCENYIQLQGVGQELPPRCQLDVDPELLEFMLPPVSLLTLVENCVKHGAVQSRALAVKITASRKQMEDGILIDILVADNGGGFPPRIIDELNRNAAREIDEVHVGLVNVIRRFRLLYGEDFAISCWNRDGAVMELMIFRPHERGENV